MTIFYGGYRPIPFKHPGVGRIMYILISLVILDLLDATLAAECGAMVPADLWAFDTMRRGPLPHTLPHAHSSAVNLKQTQQR
jgi:hypothetical protein